MEDKTNLSPSVARGGAWLFSLRLCNRALFVVRTLVLARVLLPQDFGLMGIALLSVSALETLSVTGFDRALIQREHAPDEFWDTAWLVGVVRGVILAGLIYLVAPWVVGFFNRPDGLWIVRAIGFAPLIRGLANPGVIRYFKDLKFNRFFIYEFGITFSDIVVAISLALIYRSVWALVLGNLIGQLVGMLISYLVHPHRIRLRFDKQAFRELFGYGRWVAGSQILYFILTQGYDAFVGRILGATSLGFYQMAYRLSTLSATESIIVLSNVAFPAYSMMNKDIERMRSAYLRVLRVATLMSFPIGVMIILLGSDFTKMVLGPNWIPMIPIIQILAVYGLVLSLRATTGPVFMALGRPDLPAKISFAKLLFMMLTIWPLIDHYGLSGAAWAITANALVVDPLAGYLVMKHLNGRIRDLLDAMWPAIAVSLLIAAAVSPTLYFLDGSLVRLVLGSLAGGFACLVGIGIMERMGGLELVSQARAILADRKA